MDEAGPSRGAPPAAPTKRPLPPGSGSSGSDSGVQARRLPPAERERLLRLGYDAIDLDLAEGHLFWEEEADGLDFGGVPMRDEGEDW